MIEREELTLEEAVKIVTEIGLRHEKQLEVAAARARADRQREVYREATAADPGREDMP